MRPDAIKSHFVHYYNSISARYGFAFTIYAAVPSSLSRFSVRSVSSRILLITTDTRSLHKREMAMTAEAMAATSAIATHTWTWAISIKRTIFHTQILNIYSLMYIVQGWAWAYYTLTRTQLRRSSAQIFTFPKQSRPKSEFRRIFRWNRHVSRLCTNFIQFRSIRPIHSNNLDHNSIWISVILNGSDSSTKVWLLRLQTNVAFYYLRFSGFSFHFSPTYRTY